MSSAAETQAPTEPVTQLVVISENQAVQQQAIHPLLAYETHSQLTLETFFPIKQLHLLETAVRPPWRLEIQTIFVSEKVAVLQRSVWSLLALEARAL